MNPYSVALTGVPGGVSFYTGKRRPDCYCKPQVRQSTNFAEASFSPSGYGEFAPYATDGAPRLFRKLTISATWSWDRGASGETNSGTFSYTREKNWITGTEEIVDFGGSISGQTANLIVFGVVSQSAGLAQNPDGSLYWNGFQQPRLDDDGHIYYLNWPLGLNLWYAEPYDWFGLKPEPADVALFTDSMSADTWVRTYGPSVWEFGTNPLTGSATLTHTLSEPISEEEVQGHWGDMLDVAKSAMIAVPLDYPSVGSPLNWKVRAFHGGSLGELEAEQSTASSALSAAQALLDSTPSVESGTIALRTGRRDAAQIRLDLADDAVENFADKEHIRLRLEVTTQAPEASLSFTGIYGMAVSGAAIRYMLWAMVSPWPSPLPWKLEWREAVIDHSADDVSFTDRAQETESLDSFIFSGAVESFFIRSEPFILDAPSGSGDRSLVVGLPLLDHRSSYLNSLRVRTLTAAKLGWPAYLPPGSASETWPIYRKETLRNSEGQLIAEHRWELYTEEEEDSEEGYGTPEAYWNYVVELADEDTLFPYSQFSPSPWDPSTWPEAWGNSRILEATIREFPDGSTLELSEPWLAEELESPMLAYIEAAWGESGDPDYAGPPLPPGGMQIPLDLPVAIRMRGPGGVRWAYGRSLFAQAFALPGSENYRPGRSAARSYEWTWYRVTYDFDTRLYSVEDLSDSIEYPANKSERTGWPDFSEDWETVAEEMTVPTGNVRIYLTRPLLAPGKWFWGSPVCSPVCP